MSERSYREATSPDRLQRWHGLLREAASAIPDVETVHDEIADCLDHATGWTPGVDAAERRACACPTGGWNSTCPVHGPEADPFARRQIRAER